MQLPDPLPYHASLAKVLHGPTLALVLTYLEIHHPLQQDSPETPQSAIQAPITLDCDAVCAALGISRRTLHVAFSCLGCCWGSEEDRNRAARAGREFLNPNHSPNPNGHDPVKIYSFTGPKSYFRNRIIILRRNYPKLATVLAAAQLLPNQLHCPLKCDVSVIGRSVSSELPKILKSVLPDWSDRRSGRWDRWRREHGKIGVTSLGNGQ